MVVDGSLVNGEVNKPETMIDVSGGDTAFKSVRACRRIDCKLGKVVVVVACDLDF